LFPERYRAAPIWRLTRPERCERRRLSASFIQRSWLRPMPCAVEKTVAVGLAWGGILFESVEWFALICPHLLAVVACDDRHVGGRLGIVGGQQRRPGLCAGAVAHRFAAGILVEGIERHSLAVDERLAFRRIGRL